MTQQSFDDVQVDDMYIRELLCDNLDVLFEKIRFISKTASKITISIDDFTTLELNHAGNKDFIFSSARDKLMYKHYYTIGNLKILVDENIKPNHYIAE